MSSPSSSMYKTVRLSTLVEGIRSKALPDAKKRLSEREARLMAVHAQVEKMRMRFANVTLEIDSGSDNDDEEEKAAEDTGVVAVAETSESDQLSPLPQKSSISGRRSKKGAARSEKKLWSRLRTTIRTVNAVDAAHTEPMSNSEECDELMRYWKQPHQPAPLPSFPSIKADQPELDISVRGGSRQSIHDTAALLGIVLTSTAMSHIIHHTGATAAAARSKALEATPVYEDPFPIENFDLPPFPTIDTAFLVDTEEKEISVFNEFDIEKLEISKITDIIHTRQIEVVSKELESQFDKLKVEEVNLIWREDKARQRVVDLEEKSKNRFKIEQQKIASKQVESEQQISKEFKKARENLESTLRRQYAYVREVFGNLASIDSRSIYNRYLAVQSVVSPQPVEFRIHQLKAVKSKLPQGSYCIMLSLYDSLGGSPLAWSSRRELYGIDDEHVAVTRPVHHAGRYFDHTIKFEESVFAICPPKVHIKPSYIFLLELYQLKDHVNNYDKVVAWGGMPICDEFFDVVEGKYRIPLLRGFPDPFAQHFHGIEQDMASDLSVWLCNVYFEIKCLEQPLRKFTRSDNQSTSIVELDYIKRAVDTKAYSSNNNSTNMLLKSSSGAAMDIDYDCVEGGLFRRKPQPSASDDKKKQNHHKNRRNYKNHSDGRLESSSYDYDELVDDDDDEGDDSGNDDDDDGKIQSSPNLMSMLKQASKMMSSRVLGVPDRRSSRAILKEKSSTNLERMLKLKSKPTMDTWASSTSTFSKSVVVPANAIDDDEGPVDVYERGYNHDVENDLHAQQLGKLAAFDTVEHNKYGAAALEGKVVRKFTFDGPRLDSDAIGPSSQDTRRFRQGKSADHRRLLHSATTLTSLDIATQKEWVNMTNEQEDLDQYSMALAGDVSRKRQLLPSMISRNKLRFILFEIFGDLSFHKMASFDFFITVVAFFFSFWFRIWIHYVCQYGSLLLLGVPTFDFELKVLLIFFKHIYTSLSTANEVFVVISGSLSNTIIFGIMAGLCFICERYVKWLPDGVSKFMVTYGFNVILDPVLILLIDLCYENFNCKSRYSTCSSNYSGSACTCMEAEFMLLYQRTYYDEGSGLSGILITCILYLGTTILSSLLFYFYIVYIHKRGRILDIWRRMTGNEEEFFIPHDFEISFAELSSICRRSQKWGNNEGNIRTVTIAYNNDHGSSISSKEMDDLSKKGSRSHRLDEFAVNSAYYAIHELAMDGNRNLYRHFLRNQDGTIIEIFDHSFIFNGGEDSTMAVQAMDAMENKLETVTEAYKTRAQRNYIVFTNLNRKL